MRNRRIGNTDFQTSAIVPAMDHGKSIALMIAASLGHTDLEQVKTYTASANNRRLSLSASNKLATNSPTLRPQK